MVHETGLSTLTSPARGVLVVDDDRVTRDYYRMVLEESGFTILEAHDGLTALERLVGASCWLIITDLEMPGMNGFDLIRSVRHTGAPIAILVISGRTQPAIRQQAYQAGADLVLDKPVDIATLEAHVRQLHIRCGLSA